MSKSKKDVLFVGNFCFPTGNAASNINLSMAKIFNMLKYNVFLVGTDEVKNKMLDDNKTYKNFVGTNFNKPRFLSELRLYKKKYNMLIKYIKKNVKNIKYVVLYNSPSISLFNRLLFKWCKKNNVKILVFVADWPLATYGNILFRIFKFIDTEYKMRILNKKADGIISISTYLKNYYKNKKVIVIPPVFDKEEVGKYNDSKNKKLKLIYIGFPFTTDGRKVKKDSYKDRLDIVIDFLLKIKKDFEFNIYGLSQEEYLSVIKRHNKKLDKRIIFHGKKSRDIVLNELRNSDFLIFFRKENKVTKAGFSSKFAESITCGIPVITTNTSDLSSYLKDGINGFFVDLNEDGLKKLNDIFNISKDDILKLKQSTYNSNLFNYEKYKQDVSRFLKTI